MIRYLCLDLVWRPIRRLARFLLVEHPDRGRIMFLCTDLAMNPIEVRSTLRPALQDRTFVQAGCSHAWRPCLLLLDGGLNKIGQRSGDQYLHRNIGPYRDAIRRKFAAYPRHIQIVLVKYRRDLAITRLCVLGLALRHHAGPRPRS